MLLPPAGRWCCCMQMWYDEDEAYCTLQQPSELMLFLVASHSARDTRFMTIFKSMWIYLQRPKSCFRKAIHHGLHFVAFASLCFTLSKLLWSLELLETQISKILYLETKKQTDKCTKRQKKNTHNINFTMSMCANCLFSEFDFSTKQDIKAALLKSWCLRSWCLSIL